MERVAFRPQTLPPSVLFGLALLPPLGAGIAVFGLPAAVDLGIAIAVGAAFDAIARLLRHPPPLSPIVTAAVAVALIGPAAQPWWAAVVAATAGVFEVARGLAPKPALPLSSGLLAYAVVYLAGHGRLGAYLAPGRSSRPFPEPIRLWHDFFGGGAAPLDAVTLYVGNVAGPVFATSLLAVTISALWLWYARRLDLPAVVGIAAGGLIVVVSQGWNPAYQLLSGPLLFAAVFGFADRKALAGPPLLGAAIGLAATFVGVGLRTRGTGVETSFIALAAAQVSVAFVVGFVRFVRSGAPRRAVAAVRRSKPALAVPRTGPAAVQRR
jgi:NQR2/RnfD/RnfE family subunit of NADH-ubiquinone oxidoreductase